MIKDYLTLTSRQEVVSFSPFCQIQPTITMSPIPLKPLGKNGPLVPQLGLGLMGLSAFYGAPLPDAERFKLLDRALERGCTFWDSAEAYVWQILP